MTQRISLGILSESRLFREVLSARLAREDEIELVGAASTVHWPLTLVEGRAIEVLLVYAGLESLSGTDVVWEVKTSLPATHVIVMGFGQSEKEVVQWIEAGTMAAYLPHDATYEALRTTILSVFQGQPSCSLSVLSRVLLRIDELRHTCEIDAAWQSQQPLTDREKEVARLLQRGWLNKQIAGDLGIKNSTVKTHVESILKKLNKRRRREVFE